MGEPRGRGGGGGGWAVEWSMHAQIQIFFVTEGGGGSPSPTARKQLWFFMFVLGFFSPKFSGDAGRGPTIYEGGQMLISIEFDRTCDLPGLGSGPPTPPPLPLDLHMHDI